jgi:hypothetical protein
VGCYDVDAVGGLLVAVEQAREPSPPRVFARSLNYRCPIPSLIEFRCPPLTVFRVLQIWSYIDEYQHAPAILDAIKAELNRELRPGRFVLTGSTRY